MKNLRNKQIDFLRGAAIIVVLILHFNWAYHLDQSALSHMFSAHFIKAVSTNGNYGVTVFFVISGFLITTTAFERYKTLGKINLVEFYIFRGARIVPCLLLVLSLIVLLYKMHIPIFANNHQTTSFILAIFSVLTFWHNVLMAKFGYFNYCLNIYWSLSVEEIFYLAFPLLCLFFNKMRFIVSLLLVLILIGPIFRHHYSANEIIALYGYFSCFDAIAIGCCAAIFANIYQFSTNQLSMKITQFIAVLAMIVVYLYANIMDNVVVGPSLMAVSAAVFLICAKNTKIDAINKKSGIFLNAVCWFGKNSYELYLFHIIVLALMKEIISPDELGNYTKLLWLAVFFIGATLLASLITKYYSQPLNKRLREYFVTLHSKKITATTLN